MGRADRYKTHVEPFLEDIGKWKVFHTEEQIAEMLGISYATLQNYKKLHKELNDVLLFGNKPKIELAESALMKLAEGYTETTYKGALDKDGQIVNLPVEHHYPPSLAAIKEILRRYDQYYHNEDGLTIKRQQEEVELKKNKDRREEDEHW